ncbi:MAG: hypothetical protein CMJ75_20700 [Planctomycetaceae bacterium]|nr:hypothetical protein [Planctomycetaceae bacterium]
MTGLLVSVRSAFEARLAYQGGADIIDVKEPHLGSLGAATAKVWSEVYDTIDQRVPVSIALGELREDHLSCPARPFAFAKIGLAGCQRLQGWQSKWMRRMQSLDPATDRVAVAYADWRAAGSPHPDDVLGFAVEFGCAALLVDTYQKKSGDLFSSLGNRFLRNLVEQARRQRLVTVLAGSLRGRSYDAALALQPGYVAVRGAACATERTARIDGERVRQLKRRIAEVENPDARSQEVVPVEGE